jgi:hypothetical protein
MQADLDVVRIEAEVTGQRSRRAAIGVDALAAEGMGEAQVTLGGCHSSARLCCLGSVTANIVNQDLAWEFHHYGGIGRHYE